MSNRHIKKRLLLQITSSQIFYILFYTVEGFTRLSSSDQFTQSYDPSVSCTVLSFLRVNVIFNSCVLMYLLTVQFFCPKRCCTIYIRQNSTRTECTPTLINKLYNYHQKLMDIKDLYKC